MPPVSDVRGECSLGQPELVCGRPELWSERGGIVVRIGEADGAVLECTEDGAGYLFKPLVRESECYFLRTAFIQYRGYLLIAADYRLAFINVEIAGSFLLSSCPARC